MIIGNYTIKLMTNKIPDPGTEEAIEMGCICPVMDNEYGRGWHGQEGVFIYNSGCPVHEQKFEVEVEKLHSEKISESRSKHPLTNKEEAEDQIKKFDQAQPINKDE